MMQKTRYLKLPFRFDIDRLQAELEQVAASEWLPHFNTAAYENKWSCLALRSVGGKADHILPLTNANFLDTPILKRCAYFQEVLDHFQCEKTSVRLMSLEPGGIIKEHNDVGTSFEDGLARLHIPLITDPQVNFCIDGEVVHFTRGDTWYLNASCMHSVENRSNIARIHLMLDCIVNPWLEDVFQKTGFIPRARSKYDDANINDDNVLAIIAQCRETGTPAGLLIAEKLAAIHTGVHIHLHEKPNACAPNFQDHLKVYS
jgi:quercetin dioxygenase-like cupin family protein